jgi:hypothetical protein
MNQNLTNTARPQKQFVVIILYLVFICFLLIPNTRDCFGQSITWQRTYDQFNDLDISEDVCSDGGDNFYIVGTTRPPSSFALSYVLKINKFGDTIWTRTIDNAIGRAVVLSSDGGCVITGVKNGAFTSKLDSSGNLQWSKTYTGNIIFEGTDIVKSDDGGYLVCGSAYYAAAGYVCKIDSLGELIWQEFYPSGDRKFFRRIIKAVDNGYILAGFLNYFSTDTTRGLITKIDSAGSIVWEKTFLVNNGNTGVHSILKYDSHYILSGESYNGENFRVFFKRLDINGDETFSKLFIFSMDEHLPRLAVINQNKYLISAIRYADTFPPREYSNLKFTDSLGNIILQKDYHAPEDLRINSILPLDNSDILFTGYAEYTFYPDVYALRTDSLLNAPPPIGINAITHNLPLKYSLSSFPNPFNPVTKFVFEIPVASVVEIKIYSITGREIQKLVNSSLKSGKYEIEWNASAYSSGVYFVKMVTGNGFQAACKIVLVK